MKMYLLLKNGDFPWSCSFFGRVMGFSLKNLDEKKIHPPKSQAKKKTFDRKIFGKNFTSKKS